MTPHGLLYLFLAILLRISGCSVFALPYCFLESEKKSCWNRKGNPSTEKNAGNLFSEGGVILYLILAVIGAAFYLLTTVGITGAVMLLRPEEGKITSVLIYKEYIHMAMGVFAGGLQMIGSLAFVYAVYSRFHRQKNEDVPLCRLVRSYSWLSKLGAAQSSRLSDHIICGNGRGISGSHGSESRYGSGKSERRCKYYRPPGRSSQSTGKYSQCPGVYLGMWSRTLQKLTCRKRKTEY